MTRVSEKKLMRFAFAAILAGAFLTGGALQAKTYTVYIHGFTASSKEAKRRDACRWKKDCHTWTRGYRHPTRVQVGWLGNKEWPTYGVGRAVDVLYAYCRGANRCNVITHSTGGAVIGYVLDKYARSYKLNIRKVVAMANAHGGTTVASIGNGLMAGMPQGSLYYLRPDIARRTYDHNDTAGVTVYNVAGECSVGSPITKGDDDWLIGLHSSCSYNKNFYAYKCSGEKSWGKRVGTWKNHKKKSVGCVSHGNVKSTSHQKSW